MVFHHGNGVKDGVTESNGATCRSEYWFGTSSPVCFHTV